MQRALTSVELYKRENARLKETLADGVKAEGFLANAHELLASHGATEELLEAQVVTCRCSAVRFDATEELLERRISSRSGCHMSLRTTA